jgi:hypothetical protein
MVSPRKSLTTTSVACVWYHDSLEAGRIEGCGWYCGNEGADNGRVLMPGSGLMFPRKEFFVPHSMGSSVVRSRRQGMEAYFNAWAQQQADPNESDAFCRFMDYTPEFGYPEGRPVAHRW